MGISAKPITQQNGGLMRTDLPGISFLNQGKVRDIYDMGEHLLIVTTDRLSAFDVILPDAIPDKGKVLTQISLYWFEKMRDIIPNHLVAWKVKDFPSRLQPYADQLEGRSMLVRKANPLLIEAIVRGYITGSGWKDYLATGKICGHVLPPDLQESAKLEKPIFTPSTKAELGEHDVNITMEDTRRVVGTDLADKVAGCSLAIYQRAREMAAKAGIIIADTKFEFGMTSRGLVLIDELLTPDSSRFWPANLYKPGQGQQSFDKQYVRDYLELVGFNKQPPAPRLPKEVIEGTRERYLEALERLTGRGLK